MEDAMKAKPCPFCGNDDWLEPLASKLDIGHEAHMHCHRCGANGPSVYREGKNSMEWACNVAVHEWNKRAQP
jgi:Lar family restriction alleviation protein